MVAGRASTLFWHQGSGMRWWEAGLLVLSSPSPAGTSQLPWSWDSTLQQTGSMSQPLLPLPGGRRAQQGADRTTPLRSNEAVPLAASFLPGRCHWGLREEPSCQPAHLHGDGANHCPASAGVLSVSPVGNCKYAATGPLHVNRKTACSKREDEIRARVSWYNFQNVQIAIENHSSY